MLGRRGFLKLIGAGVVGLGLALKAPEVKATTVNVTEQFGVDFEWTDLDEAAFTTRDEMDRYFLGPAAEKMSAEWDRRAFLYVDAELVTLEPSKGLRIPGRGVM